MSCHKTPIQSLSQFHSKAFYIIKSDSKPVGIQAIRTILYRWPLGHAAGRAVASVVGQELRVDPERGHGHGQTARPGHQTGALQRGQPSAAAQRRRSSGWRHVRLFFLLGLSIDVALTCRRRRQDAGKSANARALLFDISFLMLCRIAQTYGVDVLLDASAGVDASSATFFELWASEWLRPGCAPDLQLARCDPTLTDQLLKVLDVAGARDARMVSSSSFCRCHIQQVLTSGDSDLRSGQVRWHDACLHVPAVVRQILDAWQARLVSDDDVERILDTLRTQMCCLAVCAAAWLRYHIQVRLPLLD